MIQSNTIDPGNVQEAKLPRRDFVILPLLSFLTIVVCLLATEAVARHFFITGGDNSCEIEDSTIGFRFRPNCSSRTKGAESPWVTYKFNDCGYRTNESCGPKPPGTTRIALIGSSVSQGYYVRYDDIFAARAAKDLTQKFGRPVEVQNVSQECAPMCAFHRIDEALALKPNLLVLAITPFDLEHLDPSEYPNRYKPILLSPHAQAVTPHKSSPMKRVQQLFTGSYAATAMQHFLFQDPSIYVRIYLHYGDHAGYLRTPLSPAWEGRIEAYDLLLTEMAQKAHDANVPVALIEIPSMAQASLLSTNLPAGVDPNSLNQRLKQISTQHGVQFIDVLDTFKQGPKANKLFYVVDGHLNGEGHTLVSSALVEQLTKEQGPALSGRRAAVEQRR